MIVAFILLVSVFSVCGVFLTIYDKIAAIKHRRRIAEITLLFFAFMGGAASMLLTMLIIRHKTKKAMFMITLLMCLFQLVCLYYYLING